MVDELEQVLEAASISESDLDSDQYQVMDADEVLDEIVENASKCLMQTSLIDDSDY